DLLRTRIGYRLSESVVSFVRRRCQTFSLTVSPGLKGGVPRYGHAAHRKASPRPHEPHADRWVPPSDGPASAAPFVFSASARPHVQFLQAFRRVSVVQLLVGATDG